jgi:hypothetical protein
MLGNREKVKTGEVRQKPWYWLRDSQGYGSITVTLVFVSFWVTTLAYIASIVENIGGVSVRSFDVAAASTYMIPILTLYFGRKWSDRNKGFHDPETGEKTNGEIE